MPHYVPAVRRRVRNNFLQTVLPRGLGDSRVMLRNDFISDVLPHGLGAPQAYYDRINADQNALTVRLAEITAANQSAWDAIWSTLQGKTVPGTDSPFTGWGWTKQAILDTWNSIAPTKNPGEAQFAYAEKLLADTAVMVGYFKKVVPVQSGKIESEAASTKQKVEAVTPLRSPEEVGWETFNAILKERASALTSFSTTTLMWIGGGILAALGLIAWIKLK